jgi:hypothetical protein
MLHLPVGLSVVSMVTCLGAASDREGVSGTFNMGRIYQTALDSST